jgi:hypothetical protein
LIGNVTRVSGNPVALLAKDEAVMVVTAVVAGKEGGALLRMDRWGKANCKELGKCHQGGALPCKDADPCTLDSCDAAKGCTFAPNKCDDGDACTVDSCAKNSGCKHAAVDCKDGDACSTDSCDPIAGCQHPPLVCPDSNQCTASKTTCKEAPACDGQLFDGRCLKAYDKDLTWFDAQHFCAAQGRHLAVVRSKADNVALRAIVENTCAVNTNLWLGVWQDKATGATWWLTTGEKATWFGWPKDKKPYVTKSKAAILQHANGLWATHATTSKALACFICEGFTGTCTVSPANEGKTCTGSGGSGWTCKEGKCCAKYYCL